MDLPIQQNISLKKFNTFGIDVQCDYFVEINTTDQLKTLLRDSFFARMPILILGGGSNILFTKDFHGLVIKNAIKGIEVIQEDENHVWLKSGAGEVWHELVMYAVDHQWGGIENLALIPGLVGAAPIQNIGAYGVELESVFHALDAIHLATGQIHTFLKTDCQFGYRDSIFKHHAKDKYCILSVTLRLNKHPVINTTYGALQEMLKTMNISQPDIRTICQAVIAIRTSKLPDPTMLGNAGSFFKNPEIPAEQFHQLRKSFPAMPYFPAKQHRVKIPAAWLIEQCQWKGRRVGNVGSYALQPLVLVNFGNASGAEVWQLAQEIRNAVMEKFGIELQPEVEIK